jgi:protein gp37
MAKRLQAMGQLNYRNGFKVTLHEHMLDVPFTWKKPRKVFVNSMSDLFHPEVPEEFIHRVFDVMVRCPQHQFQVLTKRPERVAQMSGELPWRENVWMGTSVEDLRVISRIDHLRLADAATRFLSLEPLLGPLPNLDLTGIHWVIVGGESGPKARPIDAEWVIDIRDQCLEAGVPFFFKQWGGRNKKKTGRILEGRTWDEFPETIVADQRELIHA